MSIKAFCLTILILFTFTTQLNLIPDKNNPLIVEQPFQNNLPTFVIKFSFPSPTIQELAPKSLGSSGVVNNQFIGLQFPSTIGNTLNFDRSTPKFGCQLSDGSYTYMLTPVPSASSNLSGSNEPAEKNIAYCQLNDFSSNVPLKTGPGITYTLRINLTFSLAASYIHNMALFTSTSNTPDKLIIDSLPVLGSVRIYSSPSYNLLNLLNQSVVVTNGPGIQTNTIYPGTTFGISIQLNSIGYITSADHLVVINFPSQTLSPPTSVTSTKAGNDALSGLLKGSLNFKQFGTNSLVLQGIAENLVPGRKFNINLNGFTALNTDIGTPQDIQVIVYYKNTYSIVSSISTTSLITVNSAILTVTANHPEFWDIYRNAAWPITITFSSNVDLTDTNGLYVVIKHNNALLSSLTGGNIVTFVASTCDFSANFIIDDSFGVRPSCFPLRLDHNYPNSSSNNNFNGSGIFFYLSTDYFIPANSIFTLTVWVFADDCGGTNFNNIRGAAFSVPQFEVTVYNQITTYLLNEDRFINSQPIADGTAIFAGNCWNNQIQSFSYSSANNENINTADDSFKSDINDSATNLTLRFKEIYSWRIGSQTNVNSCSLCYVDNIQASPINEKFIYSQSNAINSDSFFLAEADLNLANNFNLSTGLPAQTASTGILPGTLTVQFSKNWFIGTNNYEANSGSTCYLSWALRDPDTLNSPTLLIDINSNIASTTTNFIGAGRNNNGVSEFDTTNTNLIMTSAEPNSQSNIMQLVSQTNNNDANTVWRYFPDEIPSSQNTKVAWFTNCLTWNTPAQITSLFAYIDVQFKWTFNDGTNQGIFSNTRLIKLFPEGGVFQDRSSTISQTIPVIQNPYINHVVLASSSGIQSTVCLVELNSAAISSIANGDSTSGVFAIWLGFGVLLETDYQDASATYPMGPLPNGATPYGLQSQTPMHPENLYVNQIYSQGNNQNVPLYVEYSQLQNPDSFGYPASTPLKGENSSAYHFLMGSLILVTGTSGGNIPSAPTPIYIPYYCPYAYPTNSSPNLEYLNFAPSIFGAWLGMSDHSSIISLNRHLYYGESNGNLASNKVSVMLSRTDSTTTIVTGPYKGYGESTISNIVSTSQNLATLKWYSYTDKINTKTLNVFSGTLNNPNPNLTCTGYSVFLNLNSIILNSSVSFTSYTGQSGFYNSAKVFYVSGKPFTTAAFMGGLSIGNDGTINNILGKDPALTSNSLQINGIPRPSLDSFLVNGQLVVSKKVGFSCASAHVNHYQAITNYFYSNNDATFILDFSPSTAPWTVTVGFDSSSENYLNDIAGNAKFTITTPASVPGGSLLVFNSNAFNPDSICGIVNGNMAQDCQYNSNGNNFSCVTNGLNSITQFIICCYNIKMSSNIYLTQLQANLETESTNPRITPYLTQFLYDSATQISRNPNPFSFTTNNSQLPNILTNGVVTISTVEYTQNSQINGMGKVILTVNLPRQPTRDMTLTISGNINAFLLQNITPRCLASFSTDGELGSNWDQGDELISACSVTGASIVINTKKNIYKCGASFSSTLYISLWPVTIVDWSDNSMNNSFTINIVNSIGDIVNNNAPAITLGTPFLQNQPNVIGQTNLCSVFSVTPPFPGEIADYVFNIDLSTNSALISRSILNEITIFWPLSLYGSNLNNINCYISGVLLNCNFSDEGILNIVLNQPLVIGLVTKITVTGVTNPLTSNDVNFACTINKTIFSTGVRTNILTGYGVLSGGVTFSGVTQTGNLRFYSVVQPLTNINPRQSSTHTFRVSFDEALSPNYLPLSIGNTPVLFVYFPSNYNFASYTMSLSVTINEYTFNSTTTLPSNTNTYNPSIVITSGNRIQINLNNVSINYMINFLYWDIIIKGIQNPLDTTVSTVPPLSQTTDPYYITLTNSIYSTFFKTVTNSNTYASSPISASYSLLNWYRGNSLAFNNTQWIIDVYTDSTQLNRLLVRPGRYSVASFDVRPNNSYGMMHAVTSLTIADPKSLFTTDQQSYHISTAIEQPVNFLVGTACGTASGYYVVTFSSTDTTDFTPLSPILIIVDSSTKGVITYQNSLNVPTAGSAWIPFSISDYNYETLNINWTPNGLNDPSSQLTNMVINNNYILSDSVDGGLDNVGKSVFSITSTSIFVGSQVFTTSDPDSCWTFNGQTTLNIAISGQVSDITNGVTLNSYFTYANYAIDNTIDRNAVKFFFTPPVNSVYLYCALVCYNSNYPSDSEILASNQGSNTYLLSYFSSFYSNSNTGNILFNNLVRGQQYKLRCIAESIEGDPTLNTILNGDIEKPAIFGSSTSATSYINPVNTILTQCAQFNFISEPGISVRNAILNYCQNLFSANGWYNNGCVICTDNTATQTVPGLSFPLQSDITCSSQNSQLRFLETNSNTSSNSITQTVCPVPSPLCTTDVGDVEGSPSYNTIFQTFTNNLSSMALINQTLWIQNVNLNTTNPILTYNDAIAPDITKLIVNISLYDQGGSVNFIAITSSPQKCYWMISESPATSPPTFYNIKNCSSAWCGNLRIGTSQVRFSTQSDNLQKFTKGTTYNVFFGCTNDLPYAQSQSVVKSVGTIYFPLPTPPIVNTNTSFFNYSLTSLLFIIILLN